MSALASTAKQTHEINKLHKRLRRNVGQAIADYNMMVTRSWFACQVVKTATPCSTF